MLAESLGVICSKRCESFIALAILHSPERICELVQCLVQDASRGATQLAAAAESLPQSAARALAIQTLAQYGLMLEVAWKAKDCH